MGKGNEEKTIPEGILELIKLCAEAFDSMYGNSGIKGFVAATFRRELDNEIVMAATRLKNTEVCKYIQNIGENCKTNFEKIAEEYHRELQDIYYYKNLLKSADSDSHFILQETLPLKYDEKGFWWKDKEKMEKKIEKHAFFYDKDNNKFRWELCNHLEKEDYDNDFDLFFLPKNISTLIFIPVPILSSVPLFFVLSNKNVINDLKSFPKKFYSHFVEWINSSLFLTNPLERFSERIHNFTETKKIKTFGMSKINEDIYKETRYLILTRVFESVNKKMLCSKQLTEKDFLSEYVEEIANIVLPLAYCITGEKDCKKDQIQPCYASICSYKCEKLHCNNLEITNTCNNNSKILKPVMLKWQACPYKFKKTCFSKKSREKYEVYIILETSKEKYRVTFFLPTFAVPYSTGYLINIQDYPGYKIAKDSFGFQMQTNFNILFENWEKTKEIEYQAIRAAISQVMARNQSHNIGAHVMNKLIGDLSKVDVTKFTNYQSDENIFNEDEKTHINKVRLEQISIFNNYVKCRMDYLADISMSTPLMQTNKYAYQDLFKDLDKVRLLLENISGLSNDFPFRIEFQKNEEEKMSETVDLLVAIPNDILGQQAFYNIIENIIRNTAKYNQVTNGNHETTFTVNFIDNDEAHSDMLKDYIAVEIYDDRKKENSDINELVKSQNEKINAHILENNKKLRPNSLGLIEMEASAAYLRKEDIVLINDDYKIDSDTDFWGKDKENPYFIKAIKNNDNCLGYRFFLHRPTLALVVTDLKEKNLGKASEYFDQIRKEGIWYITPENFENELKAGKIYTHEFVIYDGSENIKRNIEAHKTSLPIRILEMQKDEIIDFLQKDKIEKFEEKCWEKWDKLKLHLQFGTDGRNWTPTKNGKKSTIFSHNVGYGDCNKEHFFYIDALSSSGLHKLPKFNYLDLNDYYAEVFCCDKTAQKKVGESIISRILVLDERIQESAKGHYINIPLGDLYDNAGITIPNENLSAKKINKEAVEIFIDEYVKGNNEKIPLNVNTDFILIHYSILERMYASDKSKIYNYLNELGNAANVIVTSGRGEPDGLPPSVRVINLSSVITALISVRSKYFTNYIFHLSRKSSKSK